MISFHCLGTNERGAEWLLMKCQARGCGSRSDLIWLEECMAGKYSSNFCHRTLQISSLPVTICSISCSKANFLKSLLETTSEWRW
ncbi:hypothetical protein GRJ2_001215600 [Grus japonensis]|uniref:Uncharacterized protein n=1 Tax=Grus japonensis TaxID=30415 RepID=A0ABC9WPX7_GRUJA